MADIGPAFESTAKRREAKARAAEAEGNLITARDNWYMAAIHYGAAEWPYDDSGKQHVELHNKKRECFSNYARLADHKIEAVSIPFKDKSIPAWLHLPPGYRDGKVPVVIAIPGMDSFKASRSSRSTGRGNTRARCSASMSRCRIGSMPVLPWRTGCCAARKSMGRGSA